MTSVPNHRQQLSGSKYIALILLSALIIAGCSRRTAPKAEITPIATPVEKTKEEKPAVVREKIEDPEEIEAEEALPVTEPLRKHLNIAVVLPFQIDRVPLDYNPFKVDTSLFLSQDIRKSLDFYMGMKLAVDDFQANDFKANIFVLDDANNTRTVQKLMQSRPFPEVDLIIGAQHTFVAGELIRFANEKNIPFVSPFLTKLPERFGSPNFYSATPSLEAFLSKIIEKAFLMAPDKSLQLLYDPSDDEGRAIYEKTRELSIQARKNPIKAFAYNPSDSLPEALLSKQLLFIASNRSTYINETLDKLEKKGRFSVFGLPEWAADKRIQPRKLSKHEIIIPATGNNKTSEELQTFSERFIKEFSKEDNMTAVLGYDLATYLLQLAANNQLSQMSSSDLLDAKLLLHGFEFKPSYNRDGSVGLNKNTHIHYLYWRDNKFVKYE